MTFLGRKEIIRYQGKPLWARKLKGTSGIYFGLQQHQLFQQYWERDEEVGRTPGQRAKKHYQPNQRRWRLFEEGLTSGSRGLLLAQLRARQKDIPTLERASEFFGGEFRGEIISQQFFRFDKLPSPVQMELLQQGFSFVRAHKAGLKEACAQIYYLFKGLNGTVNVGAYLTKATAISDRLKEELGSKYAWSAKYSGEEEVMRVIQAQFDKIMQELGHDLAFWRKHASAISKGGQPDEVQQKILQDKISLASRALEPFRELQPFAGWAWYMINDLNRAGEAVRKGDWSTGLPILFRIGVSLEAKKLQRQMDRLKLKIDKDELFGEWDGEFYLGAIKAILKSFRELAKKEQVANFKKPVCHEVLKHLQVAEGLLSEKKFRGMKKSLRSAYLLL